MKIWAAAFMLARWWRYARIRAAGCGRVALGVVAGMHLLADDPYTFLSKLPAGKCGRPGEPRSAQTLSETDREIAIGCAESRWVQWVWCFDGMITPISVAKARELTRPVP